MDGEVLDLDGALLLDLRGAMSITARPEPAIPQADPRRIVVLRVEGPGALAEALDGTRALDARFAGSGAVVLDPDGTLRRVDAEGRGTTLDDDAHAPLSVAGDWVAYVRGAPPDVELARANVRTGHAEALTQGMAPVWSPALSNDGSQVVFVSGAAGTPRLYRLDDRGAIDALAPSPRLPSAGSAPRWRGSVLVFEDEQGVAWLDVERGEVVAEAPGATSLSSLPDGTLLGSIGGETLPLEEVGGPR